MYPHRLALCLTLALLNPTTSLADAPAPITAQDLQKTYPGILKLSVDASDTQSKIIRAKLRMPVQAGKLTLYYPQWLPGKHGPHGPVHLLAGLRFFAGQKTLPWKRDPLDMYAFEVEIPQGVNELETEYQYLSPTEGRFGRVILTEEILGLQWNAVALYPKGYAADQIQVQANLKLPAQFEAATALATTKRDANGLQFAPTSFEELIDSPVYAGKHVQRHVLNSNNAPPVRLNVFADSRELLNATPEQIGAHAKLVQEATHLFGVQPYRHYDFLLTLSEEFSGIGLEHHESSENGVSPGYFRDWAKKPASRGLLAHEFVHSWNGKFRRPQDLTTPHYNTAMQDSLLWLYEGQTQYWGMVLAARAGLFSAAQMRDSIAGLAAHYAHQSGRTWRNLQDTTNNPVYVNRREQAWGNWQRDEDYYREAALMWLAIDAKLRELTQEQRSLNDFARHFFGLTPDAKVKAYRYADIISSLKAQYDFDWDSYLRTHLDSLAPNTPTASLELSGWRLVYSEKMSDFAQSMEDSEHDFRYSLGLAMDKNGRVSQLLWDSPAMQAGVLHGSTLLAVNGRAYRAERLKNAIAEAQKLKQPINITVRHGEHFRQLTLNYTGGLKYPTLERIADKPDRLSAILAPMTKGNL